MEATATCNSSLTGFFVGCYDGGLYLLSAADGNILYCIQTQDVIKTTAAVDGALQLVLFGSYDRHLYAAAERDGTVLDRLDVQGAVFGALCLRQDARVAYAPTTNGTLWAVSYDDQGKLSPMWRVDTHCPCFTGPTIATSGDEQGTVWLGTVDGRVWVISFEGVVLRNFQLCDGPIFGSIVLDPDSSSNSNSVIRAFVTSNDSTTRCIEVDVGRSSSQLQSQSQHELVWTTELDSKISSSCFLHTAAGCSLLAVATTEGGVYLLDRRTGSVLGSKRLSGGVFATPIIVPNSLLSQAAVESGAAFHLLIGSRDDQFYDLQVQVHAQNSPSNVQDG